MKKALSIFLVLFLSIYCSINASDQIHDVSELKNALLVSYLQGLTWIPAPWDLNMYSITEIKFGNNKGSYYWGDPVNEKEWSFKYTVSEDIITINNIKEIYPGSKNIEGQYQYKLFNDVSLNGPIVLKNISERNTSPLPNELYAKELRDIQTGQRVFENYIIEWGDIPNNTTDIADFVSFPESNTPIDLALSEGVEYSLRDFYAYRSNDYLRINIKWIGSTLVNNKRWYLAYLYSDSGDKDGQDVKFIWSLGEATNYPALVFQYYSLINQKKYEDAYAIWHQKRDIQYFRTLYSDVKQIVPISVKRLELNSWSVETKLIFIDNSVKFYESIFNLSNERILDSNSIEIRR